MIRRPTIFLLGLFAALVGLVFFLQDNPLPQNDPAPTPSPTAPAALLPGWESTEIVAMKLDDAVAGSTVEMVQETATGWTLGQGGPPVELGTVEQIRSQLVGAKAAAALPGDYSLAALGLDNPAYTLVLRSSQGRESAIRIGSQTPTGLGYYVQVDEQPPLVATNLAIEAVLELFQTSAAALSTPTTGPAVTNGPTVSPTAP